MDRTTVLTAMVLLAACNKPASPPGSTSAISEPSLQAEISNMDDSLSAAFNAHNAGTLMSLFAPDLEFYHDTQGVQDYKTVGAAFRALFANSTDIRRERVGALEVYPVPGYGAIEIGAHQFCHTEAGRRNCGVFKFVQVWKREMSGWRIARVVSYAH
jgi:ketosteroid isomerase-like protein